MKMHNNPFLITLLLVLCLCINVNAQDIRLEYVRSIGEKGTNPGQFSEPRSVDVDIDGNLYIADTGNNRVQKLNMNGVFIRMFGGFGWGNDQFDLPVSIDASSGLDIYVADLNNSRITRLDRNLNFVSVIQLDNLRQAEYRFRFPAGMVVSSLGEKFVLDSENQRIIKLDAFNNPEIVFGGYSSHGIPLAGPVDLAVFENKKIFVADIELHAIMVYDYFGNFIDKYSPAVLKSPNGITVDGAGRLFIADEERKSIIILDNRGNVLLEYTNALMKNPVNLSIHKNLLYVVDKESAMLHLFTIQPE
ncbi:NHL repeat-containing protein [candidate division KSB1 bacterium]